MWAHSAPRCSWSGQVQTALANVDPALFAAVAAVDRDDGRILAVGDRRAVDGRHRVSALNRPAGSWFNIGAFVVVGVFGRHGL